MDRDALEQMLGEGLSLAEIGRRVGRHESTVAYWLRRHGLTAAGQERHAPKGRLTREELATLVNAGLSIAQIASRLSRSKGSIRHWLGRYGLKTKNARRREPCEAVLAARQAGLSRATLRCLRHGDVEHVLDGRSYFRCRLCRQEAVVRRRRRAKAILISEAGGSCRLCGYDRCAAALEFHHLDPATKEFGVAQQGMARSIARLRAEARKCILLCSNCHAEVESGVSSLSGVAQSGGLG
jgi:transposase